MLLQTQLPGKIKEEGKTRRLNGDRKKQKLLSRIFIPALTLTAPSHFPFSITSFEWRIGGRL